jgi:hypothetical protein
LTKLSAKKDRQYIDKVQLFEKNGWNFFFFKLVTQGVKKFVFLRWSRKWQHTLVTKWTQKKLYSKNPSKPFKKVKIYFFCTFFAKTFSKWLFVIKICC